MTKCRHEPVLTGRRIKASYGKPNLPFHAQPILSVGDEAICRLCECALIVHDAHLNYVEPFAELESL